MTQSRLHAAQNALAKLHEREVTLSIPIFTSRLLPGG